MLPRPWAALNEIPARPDAPAFRPRDNGTPAYLPMPVSQVYSTMLKIAQAMK
jgi:hypothetical protein